MLSFTWEGHCNIWICQSYTKPISSIFPQVVLTMLTPPSWALAVAFQNSIFLPECIPKMPVLADGTLCKSLQGHVHMHRLGLHLIVGFHAVSLQRLPGPHYWTPATLHESHHRHWVKKVGLYSNTTLLTKSMKLIKLRNTQWIRSLTQLLTLQKSYISVHTNSPVSWSPGYKNWPCCWHRNMP